MKKLIPILLVCAMLLSAAAFAETADTVIYGNIYTSDESRTGAEALAITNGVFTYVGDAAGVEEYIGDSTKVLKYDDGMIGAGFVEAHGHGHQGGTNDLFEVTLYDGASVEEYQKTLTDFIAANPDLDFINGAGWINSAFGGDDPTAEMLDAVCTDMPIVLVSEDYHSYWCNSKALEAAGITAETPDVDGGVITRDENGNPMGCFRDGANYLIQAIIPQYTVEQYKQAILYYQDYALSLGVTMYFEPMVNLDGTENLLQAYIELENEGKLKVQVYGGYQLITSDTVVDEVDHVAEVMEANKGGKFEVNDIKILLDGVVEGGTAYMSEPYATDSEYYGEVRFDLETLTAITEKANKLGITMHIHAIGDEAVTMALDAYEAGQTEGMRNAITHLQIVKDEDIQRFADLGVIAVANPYWFLKEPGYFYELEVPYLGEERAENEYPMKSFFDAGVVVTSASDYPVTLPPAPLLAIQTGVIRQDPDDDATILGADQRVTVEQMLAASTINGAYQMRCEDVRGSISVGKEADLVVLDTDIMTCDPKTIFETNVLATMIDGEFAYEK